MFIDTHPLVNRLEFSNDIQRQTIAMLICVCFVLRVSIEFQYKSTSVLSRMPFSDWIRKILLQILSSVAACAGSHFFPFAFAEN